ncbi:MAG: PAS domain-containing protein [Verrucomicrobia bacterium]|nr:PAS domain-containing protein [Verrucomicrobiota bacterium]
MRKAFPIVGIGASAGGYESFTKFLEELPVDSGMAYVLIQHLDPKHESKLTELLSRITRLPVVEVRQSVTVEPDHVYVIPPNKNLAIAGGHLKLTSRRQSDVPPMPVDFFLRSLAEDQGRNAVGMIFSGNGSDGTLGMEAIKGADGLTFAHDPATAKYDGMPRSAIASGCVDFVLPPEKMARELAKLPHHPYLAATAAEKFVESDGPANGALGKIYALLRSARGVDFSSYKQTTLKRRILRRMAVHRIGRVEEYARFLQSHTGEVEALFDDALITVTRFFREPKSYQLLAKKIFPALVKGRPRGQPIRIWVPGCASGEEVYSMAIALVEFLGGHAKDHPVQIFGTDISEAAIARARAGVYRANIAQDVSAARLRRFFTPVEEGYRISKAIRDLCVFARQNLGADPPFSQLDLICCQNVLIYFGTELQKQVIPIFHYALKPTGYLLLSPAEGIAGLSELFTQVDRHQRIFAKTSPHTQPEVTFSPKVFAEEIAAPSAEPPPPPPVLPNIEKVADRVLLQLCGPSGVVIDGKMQVLQFRGHTAPYLEHAPGAASLNLLKLVRSELVMHLRSAIAQALKGREPVHKEIAWVKTKDRRCLLKLQVVPFKVPPAKEPFLAVLFEEGRLLEPPEPSASKSVRGRDGHPRSSRAEAEVVRLREELDSTRESLQAIIEEQEATNEELKSANEEIQSSNEELQSTNEELETAKEEMQSTNEELATVNEELQNANIESGRVNNDLLNLLASVQIPVVMVDASLVVRRFTPAAQKFFNLIPTDVGRSLNDIKTSLDAPGLEAMIAEVLDTLHLKECEVRDHQGRWYSLRIRPYRTKENKIDGAVLVLVDIDELKRALEQVSDTLWEPFVALDRQLRVVKANHAFYEKFRVTPHETEGKFIYELGNRQWNIPRLRVLLEEVLPKETRISDFEVTHTFPTIGRRKMLLNAHRLETAESKRDLVLLAIQDVTPPGKR